ncbi:FAD/NAD(P)-binding domain-containing protein [Acaromyces ingoldii]|uniref:FAD/NAD(P)-binding domain-containing protein n=1 Tax=Acaromyces ingoldii TaxID=215250 RepID=A0A316YM13_9BASI|nr:FAD/NAD(P)-binding domain-containing protein [Acaromyces ingoldii]PWN88775.1 FAD/NAD(P)-binding domain-containing protein [Acaromyces ingoldii]
MRVLISGAGIAGPTLAWFRAQSGGHTTIVEKAPAILPHGQNVDINGSAITVIGKMGLLDEVRRLNTTEKGTQFIDPKGRPIAPFPVHQDSTLSPTSEYEILRGDLAKILYEATKDLDNVEYRFGTTVTKIVSDDGDEAPVKVTLSTGEEQEYDVVVAADGQWSNVRKQCFPKSAIGVFDTGMYGAYWTIPRLPQDNDWWNVYFALGRRTISLRPDPHGTTRAFVSHLPDSGAEKQEWQAASRGSRKQQEELIKRKFADAGWQAPRLLDAMGKAEDYYFQAVQQIRMTKWSAGRVVCLGDAAHAPTPLTGMGTSLALQGAYVLAGELNKLEDDGQHPRTALEAYEAKFRPFVDKIQKLPSFVPGIAHPRTKLRRWLIQTLIRAVSAVRLASGSEQRDEGFPLPQYQSLDDIAAKNWSSRGSRHPTRA